LDKAKAVLEADRKAVFEAKKHHQDVRANNEATKKRLIDLKPSANENNKTDSDVESTKPSGKPTLKKARHDTYDVYIPDEIMVEECGIPGANGTYTKCDDFTYFKAGKWNGYEGKFVLERRGSMHWCISINNLRNSKFSVSLSSCMSLSCGTHVFPAGQQGRVRYKDLYCMCSHGPVPPPDGQWGLDTGGLIPPPKISFKQIVDGVHG
jgi:hypothetical protein